MMRLFAVTAVMLLMLSGCGGSSGSDTTSLPASPHVDDSGKIPPAVPKID